MSVLGQQFLQHDFRFLHLRGIVLVLHREPDLALLEAVEHVGLGDRVQAAVLDLADGRLLFDIDVQDDALGGVFALEAQVVEVAGVPQRGEVAVDRERINRIPRLEEHARLDRVARNAAVAVTLDAGEQRRLLLRRARGRRGGCSQDAEKKEQSGGGKESTAPAQRVPVRAPCVVYRISLRVLPGSRQGAGTPAI